MLLEKLVPFLQTKIEPDTVNETGGWITIFFICYEQMLFVYSLCAGISTRHGERNRLKLKTLLGICEVVQRHQRYSRT